MRVYKERKAKGKGREISILSRQIGLKSGYALANFALTEQWFLITTAHFASQSKFLRKLVCIRTTFLMKSLSLQILSFKLRFARFQQVPAGLRLPFFQTYTVDKLAERYFSYLPLGCERSKQDSTSHSPSLLIHEISQTLQIVIVKNKSGCKNQNNK